MQCLKTTTALLALVAATMAKADATPECNENPLYVETTECGVDAYVTGENAAAIGGDSSADDFGTAVGPDALAFEFGTSVGYSATSDVAGVALGTGAGALSGAIAIGSSSNPAVDEDSTSAYGVNSIAIGQRATADLLSADSIAIGTDSFTSAPMAIAIGVDAQATAVRGTAIGPSSTASGLHGTAIGPFATASGMGASALGNGATASAIGSVALGVLSQATAQNATAVGRIANAAFAGSTAIGNGATTTAVNQVALGGAGSAVRVGDIAASTAAQDAATVGLATVDANGVLGRDTSILPALSSQSAAIGALQDDTLTLFEMTDGLRRDVRDANEGIAMALAMDSPTVPAGASFALSGGVGYFKNRTAFAGAISAAVGQMSSVSAGIGYGFKSKEIGARAGFQVAW